MQLSYRTVQSGIYGFLSTTFLAYALELTLSYNDIIFRRAKQQDEDDEFGCVFAAFHMFRHCPMTFSPWLSNIGSNEIGSSYKGLVSFTFSANPSCRVKDYLNWFAVVNIWFCCQKLHDLRVSQPIPNIYDILPVCEKKSV